MDLTIKNSGLKVVSKKTIIRKKHFSLGAYNSSGVIRILRRKTNIFVILEDLNSKLIVCRSSGTAGIIGSKRRKRTPQALESIYNVLYPYLKVYDIRLVKLIINTRINSCYFTMLRLLAGSGIQVGRICVHRKVAFNGCKGRKLRRI
jgi:ribosomal protein S11